MENLAEAGTARLIVATGLVMMVMMIMMIIIIIIIIIKVSAFLFQRLSAVLIQRYNAVATQGTFAHTTSEDEF